MAPVDLQNSDPAATGVLVGSARIRVPSRVFCACHPKSGSEAFLPTVGVFLLTVELLCLQSLKALIRHTPPL